MDCANMERTIIPGLPRPRGPKTKYSASLTRQRVTQADVGEFGRRSSARILPSMTNCAGNGRGPHTSLTRAKNSLVHTARLLKALDGLDGWIVDPTAMRIGGHMQAW